MNWTFGFPTVADDEEHSLMWRDRILCIFNSIRRLNIPNYEIIVVGGPYPKGGRNAFRLHAHGDVKHIPFDDKKDWIKDNKFTDLKKGVTFNDGKLKINPVKQSQRRMPGIKSGWITKKKNLIWQNASYENIVMFHDYYIFDQNWYEGYNRFGYDWDFCWNPKYNFFGERYRDWITWDHPTLGARKLLNYNDLSSIKYQYFDGNYIVGKKSAFEKYPLNENILHQYSEDLEWSFRVRDEKDIKIKFNPMSTVRHSVPRYTGDETFPWESPQQKQNALNFLRSKFPDVWS